MRRFECLDGAEMAQRHPDIVESCEQALLAPQPSLLRAT